ncbi:EF-hand domain-containing protein [Nonomuraea sp. NBC_01738]|uniref:EF-hand domain-containing protein n=1 Tax=Nonomuraea sp. NBC_01738 TaxID=2976003 RepID=UPI002E1237ED|nr:EF-hand domain-containing protein [Nonomuraea sp. NBC_01738]
MTLVGSAVCDRLSVPDPSKERDAVVAAYRDAWQHAVEQIGTDASGRISRDAYVRYALRPRKGRMTFAAEIIWPISDALWDALDTDGDEQLTRAEYLRLFAAYDVAGRSARNAFERLDDNRDGRVSKDEFAQAMYDFYYGSDPVPIFG